MLPLARRRGLLLDGFHEARPIARIVTSAPAFRLGAAGARLGASAPGSHAFVRSGSFTRRINTGQVFGDLPDGTINTLVELLNNPSAMSLTPQGDLLVVNSGNDWFWRAGPDSSLFDMGSTNAGFAGDGGLAVNARTRFIEAAVGTRRKDLPFRPRERPDSRSHAVPRHRPQRRSPGGQVFLVLFGTGIRGAGGPERVEATLNGESVPVLLADAQGGFAGLDQVNIRPIPRGLTGAGEVEVRRRARSTGRVSNIVTATVE